MNNFHLSYDGKQENGIIFNDTYTWGALYNGAGLRPSMSFNYDSFFATNIFDTGSYIILNGIRRNMTPEEKEEAISMCSGWVQPEDQEGGTTWLKDRKERAEIRKKMIEDNSA